MSNLSGRISGGSTVRAYTMSPTKGTGIASMVQTVISHESEGVNTWTATLTDGSTYSFDVTNGEQGATGPTGPQGATGVGITSVTKTGTSGNVDTYTITFSDGSSTTFTVTNAGDAGTVAYDGSASYPSGSIGNEVTNLKTAITTKAEIDGNYKDLTAGSADQLVSTQYHEDQEPYLYRTSGGSADIGDLENDVIVGGSVVWNQLIKNGNFANNTTGWGRGSANNVPAFRVTDGVLTFTIATTGSSATKCVFNLLKNTVPIGHVVMIGLDMHGTGAPHQGNVFVALSDAQNSPTNDRKLYSTIDYDFTKWFRAETIIKTVKENAYLSIGTRSNTEDYDDFTIDIKNVITADLTTMFGSTIADYVYSLEQTTEGSGIAWLKKYGFFTKEYYEYCEPTMRSVEGLVSHDMVGFNLFDKSTATIGKIIDANGAESNRTDYAHTDYIAVLPNTVYYLSSDSGKKVAGVLMNYDTDKKFIGGSAAYDGDSKLRQTLPDARYVVVNFAKSDLDTLNVNLSWSGTRNGEYETYEKASYPLDSSLTLRGIPKLDDQNQMYYDGDTYQPDGTVTRRYGIVDLGTLAWTYYTGTTNPSFRATLTPQMKAASASGVSNAICTKYPIVSYNTMNTAGQDKLASLFYSSVRGINIVDSAYTDRNVFKTAMSGVYLVYEVATETTENADPFVDPQRVNDWGTEEYVCSSESDFIVPVGHDTKYRVNLRDKLQHLPNSAGSDGYYLIQQSGSQMSLVNFRIPQAPAADGSYILKATVSGGVPTYTWEAVVESTATEG